MVGVRNGLTEVPLSNRSGSCLIKHFLDPEYFVHLLIEQKLGEEQDIQIPRIGSKSSVQGANSTKITRYPNQCQRLKEL